MFGVDSSELLIVAVVALLFIGPKELPGAMRTVGRIVGRVRAHARHFTSGIESMMREAELEEMEKKWREENERIMALHPAHALYPEPAGASGVPDAMPPVVDPYAAPGDAAAPAPSRDFASATGAGVPGHDVSERGESAHDEPVEEQVMLPLGMPPAPDDSHAHLPPHERPLP